MSQCTETHSMEGKGSDLRELPSCYDGGPPDKVLIYLVGELSRDRLIHELFTNKFDVLSLDLYRLQSSVPKRVSFGCLFTKHEPRPLSFPPTLRGLPPVSLSTRVRHH